MENHDHESFICGQNKDVLYLVPYREWRREESMGQPWFHYDVIKLLVSLQGQLNLLKPMLYVCCEEDCRRDFPDSDEYTGFYYGYMRRSKDDLLYGLQEEIIPTVAEFIRIFATEIQRAGLVVWDEKVPSTANAAFTACAIEGYYPVRYDPKAGSLYTILTQTVGASVKLDLTDKFTGTGTIWQTNRPSSGSAKCDTYLWAAEQYLDRCGYEFIGYIADAATVNKKGAENPFSYDITATLLPNADFLIMKKAFFLDLYVWKGIKAPDDPEQPVGADYRTLTEILKRVYEKHGGSSFTQVIGVLEFFFKYAGGSAPRHSNVETEFEYGRILSCYNCVVDGDVGGYFSMFNCSVYSQFKRKEVYENHHPDSLPDFDPQKKYLMFYMGDYDSGAWTAGQMVKCWKDTSRGRIPLAWGVNPNLCERIPVVLDYLRNYATNNDYFVGGDSGAGYLYPTMLLDGYRTHSDLPDALDAWIKWNQKYYRIFDLSITGFIHNGTSGFIDPELEGYSAFSPDGISSWNLPDREKKLINGMPAIGSYRSYMGDNQTLEERVQKLSVLLESGGYPNFYYARNVIVTPSEVEQVVTELQKKYPELEIVDPYTFFGLLKSALS